MDTSRISEEANQPLLITITNTEQEVPELGSITSNELTNTSHCSLISKLVFAVTIIAFSISCITFIICITPNAPTIQVKSMHISYTNDQTIHVWSTTFSIKNPNKKLHVTYNTPTLCVFHRKKLVWRMVKKASFVQKSLEEDDIVVKGDETGVIDVEEAREMVKEVSVMGSVSDLDVVFVGRVGFYPGTSYLWGDQNMTAFCKNVKAKLSHYDGTRSLVLLFDGQRDCSVHLPLFH
ncbi:unnamed protein product [Cochlearia groenlandica]